MPFFYIVRCADGTLYVGHTNNLGARQQAHNDGAAAAYTARRRPVRIVYSEEYESVETAVKRERQIKRWTARKKEALIAGDTKALHTSSRRRKY